MWGPQRGFLPARRLQASGEVAALLGTQGQVYKQTGRREGGACGQRGRRRETDRNKAWRRIMQAQYWVHLLYPFAAVSVSGPLLCEHPTLAEWRVFTGMCSSHEQRWPTGHYSHLPLLCSEIPYKDR
jgi:hypothetical protein